jgi:hypothetical protein
LIYVVINLRALKRLRQRQTGDISVLSQAAESEVTMPIC